MRVLDDAFDMHSGYVLNFSDRTFAEFFEDEFSIEIEDEKYYSNGSSKAKRLRAFFETEEPFLVSKVARRLWEVRQDIPKYKQDSEEYRSVESRFFSLIEKIEGGGQVLSTDAIEAFQRDQSLEELIAGIDRDIAADKPAAALDRLHTYCMKKFAHLLDKHGVSCGRDDPLHSRVGKYVKVVESKTVLREMTKRAIKSSISVFDSFNDVRNNRSFAHDSEIVDHAEAKYIFESVSALLRLFKSIEPQEFED